MAWERPDRKRSYQCNAEILRYYREVRGWTQRELAESAGYSERLISKAESGKAISATALSDLAEALSNGKQQVCPEDLIADPVAMANAYIAAEYERPPRVYERIRPFLDEEAVVKVAGDPSVFPFAGEHRGHAAIEAAFDKFYSVLEAPKGHDYRPWYRFQAQGNQVVVWGESWLHPIGQPMGEPMKLVHLMDFRRGKLCRVEVMFDTLKGADELKVGNTTDE